MKRKSDRHLIKEAIAVILTRIHIKQPLARRHPQILQWRVTSELIHSLNGRKALTLNVFADMARLQKL